ncbi:gliding motility protein RemB [Flavobacterium croceum]|uniref:gliding motility protein RemB n=1 Tax=Flavobacterium croceum TaxID=370975 RepID=UPI0024A83156|nr:gliding motility protein RemB [Flavobacterium croceum]
MRKHICILLVFYGSFFGYSQKSNEQPPLFPNCQVASQSEIEKCFYAQLQDFVYHNFNVPNTISSTYKGTVLVLFEVDTKGAFKTLYIDTDKPELAEEAKKVFLKLPTVTPATYNGNPIYSKYTLAVKIPLQAPNALENSATEEQYYANKSQSNNQKIASELDRIENTTFTNPQYKSNLSIPFSHSYYAQFEPSLNQMGLNSHTASKPFTYAEVSNYYNLENQVTKLYKNKSSWWGRKLWNENMVALQGKDYWFTLNPIFDIQLGKNTNSNFDYTYINTRGLQIRGGVGSKLNFATTIYESQGRFADYYNDLSNSLKPGGGNPAIIPGIGIAKDFKTNAYDFPSAEANITFAPSKNFDLQLGYGRNFIGDGYRSLLLGDGTSMYPYFKINTKFWKIKYTNLYTWLKDVRESVTVDRTYATKYVASHYLSWNVTNKFNLGLFESVVWTNQNNRGFDMSFVNPIIFYRTVEFSSSSRSGNALLGLTTKYKWNNSINLYGQFLLDEFSLNEVKNVNNSWKNKFAYQIGAKYYNAFRVKDLFLQLEYNHIRPYVYAHSDVLTNYGHNNQSLAHPWGGNSKELLAIARYQYQRYFAQAQLTYGLRGLDFDTAIDTYNYGGNIYRDYDENRPFDSNVKIGQGNKTTIMMGNLQAGYLINPQTNMKLFANLLYRKFTPTQNTDLVKKQNTLWFSFGVRCDIFNWYFDY